MRRQWAIEALGASQVEAAAAVGVERSAVGMWPDPVMPITRDRVIAAMVRREMARAMGLTLEQFHANGDAQASMEHALRHNAEGLLHLARRAAEHFRQTTGRIVVARMPATPPLTSAASANVQDLAQGDAA